MKTVVWSVGAFMLGSLVGPANTIAETNRALSATATASSYYQDGMSYVWYCNDGDTNTWWSGNDRHFVPSSYYWLQLDFGRVASFTDIRLNGFRREPGQETWLSISDDGINWSDVPDTGHTDGPSEPPVKDYSVGFTEARYLLLNFIWPAAGAQPSLAEFEVYDRSGGIVITSFHGNGILEWQGCEPGTVCRVEWAASLTDPGRTNWQVLTNLVVTDFAMSADVPMFYRVVGTPADSLTNVTLSATENCIISGVPGNTGACSHNFVSFDTEQPGDYTIVVELHSLHIGGSTTQLCLLAPKSPTGHGYHVLNPGTNHVYSRTGEFVLFFVDQMTLTDNSGYATVILSEPASFRTNVDARANCLTTFTGPCSSSFVNIDFGTGGTYFLDMDLFHLHIGGDTTQAFALAPKSGTGHGYHVLNPGVNRIYSRTGEFSLFFVDQATLSDNYGFATVKFFR